MHTNSYCCGGYNRGGKSGQGICRCTGAFSRIGGLLAFYSVMYAFFAVVLHNIYTPYNKILIFLLTFIISCVIIFYADEKVFFLCAKIGAQLIYPDIAFCKKPRRCKRMRVKITLACSQCKQRNYNTMKNKKNDPDRLEMKKYCRFCREHTLHKETK